MRIFLPFFLIRFSIPKKFSSFIIREELCIFKRFQKIFFKKTLRLKKIEVEVLILISPVSDTVSELSFQKALHSHSWTRARALLGSLLESLLRLHFHRND